jgi:hypothetical protein
MWVQDRITAGEVTTMFAHIPTPRTPTIERGVHGTVGGHGGYEMPVTCVPRH